MCAAFLVKLNLKLRVNLKILQTASSCLVACEAIGNNGGKRSGRGHSICDPYSYLETVFHLAIIEREWTRQRREEVTPFTLKFKNLVFVIASQLNKKYLSKGIHCPSSCSLAFGFVFLKQWKFPFLCLSVLSWMIAPGTWGSPGQRVVWLPSVQDLAVRVRKCLYLILPLCACVLRQLSVWFLVQESTLKQPLPTLWYWPLGKLFLG